jgi:hypothetical protein
MDLDVTTAVVIDRPCTEVAAYSSDPDNAPFWYGEVNAVAWETPRPLCVGSRFALTVEWLRIRLTYNYQIVAWVPGDRLTMRMNRGPDVWETSYSWERVTDECTRMTLRNRGPSSWLAPLLALIIRYGNRKDLQRLKERLERGV